MITPYDDAVRNGDPLFAIQNIEDNTWVLDCFDNVRLFFLKEKAEEYRTSCYDYANDKYEVRSWKLNP